MHQPSYKLSASCPPEELLSRLGVAVCNLYGIIATSASAAGEPTNMEPVDYNLGLLGLKIEPGTLPLVDITPKNVQ